MFRTDYKEERLHSNLLHMTRAAFSRKHAKFTNPEVPLK
jgi:hypothetical protein